MRMRPDDVVWQLPDGTLVGPLRACWEDTDDGSVRVVVTCEVERPVRAPDPERKPTGD